MTRLIFGGPLSTWERCEYRDVVFAAGTTSGTTAANWLHNRRITDDYVGQLPIVPITTSVYTVRHPSHVLWGGTFTFSLPFTSYTVNFTQKPVQLEYSLASEGAPFFLTLWEAERHLLYDIPEGTPTIQTPTEAIYAYIEHPEAWLERIHFSLSALEIHLAGPLLEGARLKVIGSGIAGYDSYPAETSVSIPLPNGRPDYLKIALLRSDTWLDYFIDDKNSRANPHAQKHTHVTFAEPEPQEKVQELIDRGEGKTIEFKHELHFSNHKIKWLKTIIAFANGEGGNLVIGVDDENGTVVGIHYNNLAKHNGSIAKFKDEITKTIRDTIDPMPDFDYIDATIDGRSVLVVNVKAIPGKCYAAYEGEVPVYYIRRAATTRKADNNEVQDLVRTKSAILRAPTQNNPWPQLGEPRGL